MTKTKGPKQMTKIRNDSGEAIPLNNPVEILPQLNIYAKIEIKWIHWMGWYIQLKKNTGIQG